MFGEILYSSDMQQYRCIHEAPSNKIARCIADPYTYLCGDNIFLSVFESGVITLDKLGQVIINCREKLNIKLAGSLKEDDDEDEEGNENTEEDDKYDKYDDEEDDEMEFKIPFHVSLNHMRLTRRSGFNK